MASLFRSWASLTADKTMIPLLMHKSWLGLRALVTRCVGRKFAHPNVASPWHGRESITRDFSRPGWQNLLNKWPDWVRHGSICSRPCMIHIPWPTSWWGVLLRRKLFQTRDFWLHSWPMRRRNGFRCIRKSLILTRPIHLQQFDQVCCFFKIIRHDTPYTVYTVNLYLYLYLYWYWHWLTTTTVSYYCILWSNLLADQLSRTNHSKGQWWHHMIVKRCSEFWLCLCLWGAPVCPWFRICPPWSWQVSPTDLEKAFKDYAQVAEFQALTRREKEIVGFLDTVLPMRSDDEQTVDV